MLIIMLFSMILNNDFNLQQNDLSFKMNNTDFEENGSPYIGLNLSCDYYDNEKLINNFKNSKNFKLLSWNLGSLPSKYNEFKDFLNNLSNNKVSFDILCIQEIYQIIDMDLFKLDNYNFVFKDRKKGKGGGIGI